MHIVDRGQKTHIPSDSPFADIVRSVINAFGTERNSDGPTPERNDVKNWLWPELREEQKRFLYEVATHPLGVGQKALENALSGGWVGLRGAHNGLARICVRLRMDKPVWETGYNSSNRRYHMSPDAAKTVIKLWKREEHP